MPAPSVRTAIVVRLIVRLLREKLNFMIVSFRFRAGEKYPLAL
jgi:hypothetical protein